MVNTKTITKGEFVNLTRNLPQDNRFISADGSYTLRLKVGKSTLTKRPVVYGHKLTRQGTVDNHRHPMLDFDKFNSIENVVVRKVVDEKTLKETVAGLTLNYKYNRKSVNLVAQSAVQGILA